MSGEGRIVAQAAIALGHALTSALLVTAEVLAAIKVTDIVSLTGVIKRVHR
jgi:hypothetical protein